jgi:phosphoglycolate phosphatase-like HAD superfamily hydrolase
MFFHDELLSAVAARGLDIHLSRVDGLRETTGGGPKAPHLKAHLNALGVRGDECILIGDSVDDAHAAEEVGATAILYRGGFTHEDALRATGRPVASTLVEAVHLALAG